MITHEEITITKYETEFVAKHKDYDVIGVGGNEFEAVLELSKALGALMFSKDYKHNKVTQLLGLYKTERHIAPLGVVISKSIEEEVRLNTRLKVIRFDIEQLEKELGYELKQMTGVEMLNALGYVEDKHHTNQFIDESHGDGDYAFVRFISTFKDVEIGYYDGYGGKGETTFRASGELLLACIQYMKDNGWIK